MIRLVLILIPGALLITGCVNAKMNTVKDTKAAPSYSVPQTKPIPEQLKKDSDAYRYNDPGRAYSLTLKNADLKDVLMLLSKESGVSIVAERGLRGMVQIEAKNRKLGEILYTILKPLGYTASVENGMILVGRPKLTTRTFRMNYLKDTRNSSSNMNVSGFAAGGSGSVSVSTTGKSDYWGAVENSLEMLVFGTSGMGRRSDGGYIRGEAEKKQVAESKSAGTAQTTSRGSVQSNVNNRNSYANIKSGYDESNIFTSQSTEIDDPMLLNTQINENQLKQLVVNEIAGIIQITDYSENLDKIASFLKDIEEGSKRQVLIQAHIMEVSLSDSFSMGIDWNTIIKNSTTFSISQAVIPTTSGATTVGSNVFKFSATGDKFGVMLDALKEQGNVNMLSSPKITALNNQKAVIKLTTKEVSWVSSKTTSTNTNSTDTFTTTPQVDEVGIFLDVTPQIAPDGSIIMQIHPSVSEIREMSTSPDKTSTKPVINVREIDTMVDAKAGETIVIAGLISDKLSESKRGIPLLEDIPYLGSLFSYRSQNRAKTELVIMMTPYFLNAKSIDEIRRDHEQRMQNIGGDFHLINNLGSMITEKSSRDWIMRSEPSRRQPKTEREDVLPTQKKSDQATSPLLNTVTNEVEPVRPISIKTDMASSGTKKMSQPETVVQLQPQQAKIEEMKTAVQPEQESVPLSAAAVQTVSVTTGREQTLYRSAVTAYKIGDCTESIKAFDTFSKAYPNSPFSSDAAYYRKDCIERLSAATAR